MGQLLERFLADRSAATAIEYSLIAAGVALAVVTAIGSLGTAVLGSYTKVDAAFK